MSIWDQSYSDTPIPQGTPTTPTTPKPQGKMSIWDTPFEIPSVDVTGFLGVPSAPKENLLGGHYVTDAERAQTNTARAQTNTARVPLPYSSVGSQTRMDELPPSPAPLTAPTRPPESNTPISDIAAADPTGITKIPVLGGLAAGIGALGNEIGKGLTGAWGKTQGDEVGAIPFNTAVAGIPGIGIGVAGLQSIAPQSKQALSTPIRDVPALGTLVRAGEAIGGAANAGTKVIGEPTATATAFMREATPKNVRDVVRNAAMVGDPFAQLITGLWGRDNPKLFEAVGVTPQEAEDLTRGFLTFQNTPEQNRKFEEMLHKGSASEATVNPAPHLIVSAASDPLTWLDAGAVLPKIGKMQELRRVWAAAGDVTKAGELVGEANPLERLIARAFQPASVKEGEIIGKEALGIVQKADNNPLIRTIRAFTKTPTAKTIDNVERAIGNIAPYLSDTGRTLGEKVKLLQAISEAAPTGKITPRLAEQMAAQGIKNSEDFHRVLQAIGNYNPKKVLGEYKRAQEMLASLEQTTHTTRAGAYSGPISEFIGSQAEGLGGGYKSVFDHVLDGWKTGKLDLEQARTGIERVAGIRLTADLTDHMGATLAHIAQIPKPNAVTNIVNTMKRYEGLLYVGANPASMINNVVNDMSTLIRHGADIKTQGQLDDLFKRYGMAYQDNIGAGVRKATGDVNKGETVGAYGSAQPDWTKKIPVLKQVNEAFEKSQAWGRQLARATGMERFMASNFKPPKLTPKLMEFYGDEAKQVAYELQHARNFDEAQNIMRRGAPTWSRYTDDIADELSKVFSEVAGKEFVLTPDMVKDGLPLATREQYNKVLRATWEAVQNGEDAPTAYRRARFKIYGEDLKNDTFADLFPEAKPNPPAAPEMGGAATETSANVPVRTPPPAAESPDLAAQLRSQEQGYFSQPPAPRGIHEAVRESRFRRILPPPPDASTGVDDIRRYVTENPALNVVDKGAWDNLLTFKNADGTPRYTAAELATWRPHTIEEVAIRNGYASSTYNDFLRVFEKKTGKDATKTGDYYKNLLNAELKRKGYYDPDLADIKPFESWDDIRQRPHEAYRLLRDYNSYPTLQEGEFKLQLRLKMIDDGIPDELQQGIETIYDALGNTAAKKAGVNVDTWWVQNMGGVEGSPTTHTLRGLKQTAKEIEQEAISQFGLTNDPREAGYIMTDGRMLDFSGRKFGAGESARGKRYMDHRDISKVMEKAMDGGESMTAFMDEGNVRWDYSLDDHVFINVAKLPTPEQMEVISRHAAGRNVTFEITNARTGYPIYTAELNRANKKKLMEMFGKAQEELSDKGISLYQGAAGATDYLPDGRRLMRFFKGEADASTYVHEAAHVFMPTLDASDMDELAKWTGLDSGEQLRDLHNRWVSQDPALGNLPGGKRAPYQFRDMASAKTDAEKYVIAQEKFARGFEKYLSEGVAPTEGLQRVFEQFKDFLLEIYRGITGSDIDVKLTDEMRTLYGKMLDADQVMSPAEIKKIQQGIVREVRGDMGEAHLAAGFFDAFFQHGIPESKKIWQYTKATEGMPQWWYPISNGRNIGTVGGVRRMPPFVSPVGPNKAQLFGTAKKDWKLVNGSDNPEWADFVLDHYREWTNQPLETIDDLLALVEDNVAHNSPLRTLEQRGVKRVKGQMDMFGAGSPLENTDLPLFSGTAQTAKESAFVPQEVAQQGTMFDMRPEFRGTLTSTTEVPSGRTDISRTATDTATEGIGRNDTQLYSSAPTGRIDIGKGVGDVAPRSQAAVGGVERLQGGIGGQNQFGEFDSGVGGDLSPVSSGGSVGGQVADLPSAGTVTGSVETPNLAPRPLPPFPPVPETGEFNTAIRADDGTIYYTNKPNTTHVLFIKETGIPPERIVDGGWVKDGVYHETYRSDTQKYVEQYKAQMRVNEKRPGAFSLFQDVANRMKEEGAGSVLNGQLNKDAMDAMEQVLLDRIGAKFSEDATQAARVIPDDVLTEMDNYLRTQYMPELNTAKQGAGAAGRLFQDATVLNYDGQWNIETALLLERPFVHWMLHTALNYTKDFIDHPALLAFLLKLREMMNQQSEGMPDRFKGAVEMQMPLAERLGLGDSVWIRPMRALMPYEDVLQLNALDRASYQTTKEDGTTDLNNVVNDVFGIHLPIKLATNLLAGDQEEAQQSIASIPMLRAIRGLTSPLVPGGVNFGLESKYDKFYLERALKELVAEGKLTSEQAGVALLQQTGKDWEAVKQRAGLEGYGIKEMTGLLPIVGRGAAFTPGEQKYIESQRAREKLQADAVRQYGGYPNMTPEQRYQFLSDKGFYKSPEWLQFKEQNPALETGSLIGKAYDDNGDRMPQDEAQLARERAYYLDKIATAYYNVPELQQKLIAADLGEDFKRLFLDKTTKNTDAIPREMLLGWADRVGALLNKPTAGTEMVYPDPFKNTFTSADQNARYQEFYDQVEQGIGHQTLHELETAYFGIADKAQRAAYLAQHPELKIEWDAERKFYEDNPDILKVMEQAGLKKPSAANANPTQGQALNQAVIAAGLNWDDIDKWKEEYNALPKGTGARTKYLSAKPGLLRYFQLSGAIYKTDAELQQGQGGGSSGTPHLPFYLRPSYDPQVREPKYRRPDRPIGGKGYTSTRSLYQLFQTLKRKYPPKPQGQGGAPIAYRDGATFR